MACLLHSFVPEPFTHEAACMTAGPLFAEAAAEEGREAMTGPGQASSLVSQLGLCTGDPRTCSLRAGAGPS